MPTVLTIKRWWGGRGGQPGEARRSDLDLEVLVTCDIDEDGVLCGSLPVEVLSVSLVWCSAHQAWRIHSSKTQQATDEVKTLHRTTDRLGPFDSKEDAGRVAGQALSDLLAL